MAWFYLALALALVPLAFWISWRASRHWQDVQAMQKAAGETLDFRALASDPIPDEENFCAIPLLKDLSLSVDGDSSKGIPAENRARLAALKLEPKTKPGHRPEFSSSLLGRSTDLKAWAEALRDTGKPSGAPESSDAAREVLTTLSKYDAIVRDLAAGLVRPRAQWTPSIRTRELPRAVVSLGLPHYRSVVNANGMLCLRCIASARAGEIGKACEAAQIMARFSEASLDQPLFIAHLVAANCGDALATATWELCDAHAGSAEDLAKLEAALARLNFRRSALNAFRGELATSVDFMQAVKETGCKPAILATPGGDAAQIGELIKALHMRGLPAGVFDASSAFLAEREVGFLIKPLRDEGWLRAIQSAEEFHDYIKESGIRIFMNPPGYIMATITASSAGTILRRSARVQVVVNQAVIACALERFRIEKGSYPESLDEVRLTSGEALPLDEINGKPMGYRKTENGRYVLWSVGFDGKDDGGKRALDGADALTNLKQLEDLSYKGDWVWDFPTDTATAGEKHE